MYDYSLPPTNLSRAANSFRRGVLVLVSIGARKVEGGWVIPGPGYEPDEGLRFVRDADVSRFACDLRMVKKAEEALGHVDCFTVAKEIEDWWVARIGGLPGQPHIVVRGWPECEARALMIILRAYAEAAGLYEIEEYRG